MENVPAEHIPARMEDRVGAAWEPLALIGVLMLAFGLRQALLGDRPLWIDEGYSLEVATKPFRTLLAILRVSEPHPVGYYALLSLWIRWFGTGLAQTRSLSLLFGMGAVLLTWRLGRRLFSPPIGIVAAALVAVNPFQIIASNEMRMYMPLTVLALASTWVLWRATQTPETVWWWGAYGLSAAAMAYTSYYAFLLLPAHVLWVLRSRPSRRTVIGLGVAGAVAVALYLPWIPYLLTLPDKTPPWRQPFAPEYLPYLFATQTFGGYLFNAGSYFTFGNGFDLKYTLLLLLPFAVLMGAGIFALGRINAPGRLLLGLSWSVPIALVILVSLAAGGVAAYPRHLVFLEPFAAVFVAAGIVHLREAAVAAPKGVIPLLGVLLAGAFVYPAVDNVQGNPAYEPYRYDLAADFMRARYRPGDVVIFFPSGTALPFGYYFNPPGQQIRMFLRRRQWSGAAAQMTIREVADLLVAHKFERVWLVYSEPWPEGSLEYMNQTLAEKAFHRGPVADFQGLWVTLFVRPSR